MNKKRIIVILSVLTLTLGALALGQQGQSNQSLQSERAGIPEHVIYKHLFHHVAALKLKAEEAESEGKDGAQFRTQYQRRARLSDEQARILEETASDVDREIKQQDEKAKPLIQAYKAQYPDGQVPHGEMPKPPPAELRTLSEERDAIVLRARDRLRVALGDKEFNRFNGFVKERVAPNVYVIPTKQSPSAAKNGRQ